MKMRWCGRSWCLVFNFFYFFSYGYGLRVHTCNCKTVNVYVCTYTLVQFSCTPCYLYTQRYRVQCSLLASVL